MNVLIVPSDDRQGQLALIYHYSKLGHNVFIPKFESTKLGWNRIATWPGLLCKSIKDPTKRNIEIFGFDYNQKNIFGEDAFLHYYDIGKLYDDDIKCDLIDLKEEKIDIQAYHTLRGATRDENNIIELKDKYFKNAIHISSTLSPIDEQNNLKTKINKDTNYFCKFIPAKYEDYFLNKKSFNILANDFELKIFNIDISKDKVRKGIASFNHNFSQRQPSDFTFFKQLNNKLQNKILNYGGNIRCQGADIRYSENNGITGKNKTLSIYEALKFISTLKAILVLKETDWGGGVFYNALNCETPIITTQKYINNSNAKKHLIHNKNCIVINSVDECVKAINKVENDDQFSNNLSLGMKEIKNNIFNEDYWNEWERFNKSITISEIN